MKHYYIDERSRAFRDIDGLEDKNGWLKLDETILTSKKRSIEEKIRERMETNK